MTRRISREEAIQKYEREMKNRELIKQGIKVKSNKLERRKKQRQSNYQKFVDMLKHRGGHISQKEKEKKDAMEKENKRQENDK